MALEWMSFFLYVLCTILAIREGIHHSIDGWAGVRGGKSGGMYRMGNVKSILGYTLPITCLLSAA